MLNNENIADLYVRVSSTEQAEEGYSVAEQEARLRSYCDALNIKIHAVHIDPGFSGASLDRPGIKKVIEDVRAHKCNKVIVWKLDRLSRSQKDTLILLEDIFLQNDCHFISLMESFDTSTPFGRCIVGILAAFAQMERENIKLRTNMGIQAGLKAGYYYAAKAPLGYMYQTNADQKKELVPDPFWSLMIKELYERIDAGEPFRRIALSFQSTYGFWKGSENATATELSRISRRCVYCGDTARGGKVMEGRHPALVDRELWKRVNEKLKKNQKAFKRIYSRSNGILSGLLFCQYCGARLAIHNWAGASKDSRSDRYACYSVMKNSKSMIKDPNCTNRGRGATFTVDELDSLILEEIKKLALSRESFDALVNKKTPEDSQIEAFRERLAEVGRQISRILNLYQAGIMDMDEIGDRMSELKEQRNSLENSIAELERQCEKECSVERAWELLATLNSVIESGDSEALTALVHALIDKIVIYKKEVVEIHWSFC